MHVIYLLAAVLLGLAAFLWYTQAKIPEKPEPSARIVPASPDVVPPQTMEALLDAIEALRSLMDHPSLGGPGFLTVRLRQTEAEVTAQYPNIREAMYRRIIRQELSPPELLLDGAPERLLRLSPEFETESGGMVLVTARLASIQTPAQSLDSFHNRQHVLSALTAELRRRCPGLTVRILGGEIILTPVRG